MPIFPSKELFRNNRKVKWIILIVSAIIITGSIYYTNRLVNQLKEREHTQVELYAAAVQYLANESGNEILFISDHIINKNNSIPTIMIDQKERVLAHTNITVERKWTQARTNQVLHEELEKMKRAYPPVEIVIRDPRTKEVFGVNYVYYRNSQLLSQLIAYPYIQLSVLAIFAFISYLAFNYSKVAEQNQVWVGLTKETAHQLGTPISSLMAWAEVLREMPEMANKGVVEELDKDIKKLEIITERFSSIGSAPVLKIESVNALVNNVFSYLRPRVSSKIKFEVEAVSDNINAMAHAPLFEWVIENICKNSVDAIKESGKISAKIMRGGGGKVFIDITDTGKGMSPVVSANIFNPGYTTKKRGWGLGLALAKRIIEKYHNGRIYVRFSQENAGTTFRIELQSLERHKAKIKS
ncbi:MAG: histidine kinase [Candidatus Nephrothrix sp. EaCA]|nr:MAG: histidine kinase [Candidatus Nephrothrix sp. EaCA]